MIHGINDNHTHDKKTFKQQWNDFRKYFDNQTVIAHNAAFDLSVLRASLEFSRLKYPDLDYHCTLRLSQETLALSSNTLADVSKYLKIKLQHHNAESDAQATALIALKLCEKFKVNSLEELSTSLGFKVGKIVSQTKTYRPFSKR
jgi:DNA polymerase-3 subunit epsilon